MNLTSELVPDTVVKKRGGLSPAEFQREYMRTNCPVVLTDVLGDWPALGKWTPQFSGDNFPDREFTTLSCNVGNSTNWSAMNRLKASLYFLAKGWKCKLQDVLG